MEIVRERAEAAGLSGDELAAERWRDIATAAERMLRESGGYQVYRATQKQMAGKDPTRLDPPVMDGQNT